MLKKNWCLIVLLLLIVVGGLLFYRWYKYYHYSPIEGHTETLSGTRSTDDYYACFTESETNVIVLRANQAGIKKEGVILVDLNQMGNIDPTKPDNQVGKIIYPPTPTPTPSPNPPPNPTPTPSEVVVTTTDLPGGQTEIRIKDTAHHFHLGPGPYMVAASAPTTPSVGKRGDPTILFYYYQTYDKGHGPDQCSVYRPDSNVLKPTK